MHACLQAKAEKQRLHEEAKALEKKKKEELRADQLVAEAQVGLKSYWKDGCMHGCQVDPCEASYAVNKNS